MKCPHCGGAVQVLFPADAVHDAVQARDDLTDALADTIARWANAEAAMARGVVLVEAEPE